MSPQGTDFTLSLEALTGLAEGDPEDAPTAMVAAIRRSWKKPLNQLSDSEIGELVVQHCGYPYVLDLLWPKLEADPLFDGGFYPGDVLSTSFVLIRAFGGTGRNMKLGSRHCIAVLLRGQTMRMTHFERV
jgi:hypothetical protein